MEQEVPHSNSKITAPLASLGSAVHGFVGEAGATAIFLGRALVRIFHPKQGTPILEQIYFIGARSAGIVMLVGLFTGMVLGLQVYHTLAKVGSQGALGAVLALSLIRELGPVLAAVMITARAGSSMTAEIGTQRISEQVDALITMRIDPVRFLVSPRVAASLVSFPLLTAVFDVLGILGGYISSVLLLQLNSGTFFHGIRSSVEMADINGGIAKAFVFGTLVSTICCFQGFFTHLRTEAAGAKGVGHSTTSAVVQSCVLILVADYVVTSLLM